MDTMLFYVNDHHMSTRTFLPSRPMILISHGYFCIFKSKLHLLGFISIVSFQTAAYKYGHMTFCSIMELAGVAGAPAQRCSEFHGVRSKRQGAWPGLWLCWSHIVPAATDRRPSNTIGTGAGWSSADENEPIHILNLQPSHRFTRKRLTHIQACCISSDQVLFFHGHGGRSCQYGGVPLVILA